ncbi:MAG: helix-turn-helix transcriptional regulator [Lachnospiraceae bacterium]|nr:helix-turn-helix transcriptional regulator [Lachnospiraceae bacterium]
MHEKNTVGKRIMILRQERGYSRETLARLSEISSKFIYEIETDKKGFSAYTLQKIAESLEVSLDYIMTGKNYRIYDEEVFDMIYHFKPNTLEAVKELLKAAYKIAIDG